MIAIVIHTLYIYRLEIETGLTELLNLLIHTINWVKSVSFSVLGWGFEMIGDYFEWVCGIYGGLSVASKDTGSALKISHFEMNIDYFSIISTDVVVLVNDDS